MEKHRGEFSHMADRKKKTVEKEAKLYGQRFERCPRTCWSQSMARDIAKSSEEDVRSPWTVIATLWTTSAQPKVVLIGISSINVYK
ncbi:hypothetical protein Taro_037171 [Colocasia esculenta]|uniref:Uncharacterized protein n=1 Tax=Colocasia esculenta TaxID=4460 RepID=A0A843W8Y6_COLES|nr:hypothetical protein [Colocasia esculenta]